LAYVGALSSRSVHVSSLSKAYDHYYGVWLPSSGYEIAESFGFEYYDETLRGSDHQENVTELYFPVRKR
jgi:predicted transcriptional regulator YdeE